MALGMLIVAAALAMAPAEPVASLGSFDWMSGHWRTPVGPMPASGPNWTEEFWTSADGHRLVGLSRSQQGFGRFSFEFMRIEQGDDGIAFYGSPGGAPAVPFRLVRAGAGEAVFENADHDYPQRIVYRREGEVLVATISKIDGSDAQSWRYESYRPRAE